MVDFKATFWYNKNMNNNVHMIVDGNFFNTQEYFMTMEKLFTVAGYSTKDGKTKPRFATDMARVKTLVKTGHTDIQLYDLPKPLSKVASLQFLADKNFQGAGGVAIANELAKRLKSVVADLAKTDPVKKAA